MRISALWVALALTACADRGVPAPEPVPLTIAREYSGLWVPDSARVLEYEDSFYLDGRMRRQGILKLTMQLAPSDFEALADAAAGRGYRDLQSRRTLPADSVGYQDAYLVPISTPGLYLITRGAEPNHITVVLRQDNHTLNLEMVQLSYGFFLASASDTVSSGTVVPTANAASSPSGGQSTARCGGYADNAEYVAIVKRLRNTHHIRFRFDS